MDIHFLAPAQQEVDEAYDYYETQMRGLGAQFLDELLQRLKSIKEYPEAWPKFSRRTRRCLFLRFPYGIIYQQKEDSILIIAVSHLHRKPDYWRERL